MSKSNDAGCLLFILTLLALKEIDKHTNNRLLDNLFTGRLKSAKSVTNDATKQSTNFYISII